MTESEERGARIDARVRRRLATERADVVLYTQRIDHAGRIRDAERLDLAIDRPSSTAGRFVRYPGGEIRTARDGPATTARGTD